MAGKLLMKPHRVGILGLWVIGVAVAILLSCSIEEAQPIPTNAPAPISTLTARQQEAIDHLKGRKSLATPIPTPTVMLTVTFIPTRTPARLPPPTFTSRQQEALDYATGRKSVGTPTPAPTPTATPVPTPTSIPCKSKACGQGYFPNGGLGAAKDLWPDITSGERQLAGFVAECELTGVGYREYTQDGDRSKWVKVQRQYLPDQPLGDIIKVGLNPWGPVWQDREWWWEEEQISVDGSGAYREGGSCLLVYDNRKPLYEPGTSLKVRLVPRGDTTLSSEQLEFGEGYHYISDETGYDGIYDVEMWWEDPDVLTEDREGDVILFHFLSYGPGRRDVDDPPADHIEVARGAWNWCCSREAKETRERLRSQ